VSSDAAATTDRFPWGTDIVRRESGLPFLVYEPRRTDAADLLDDVRHWGERVHLVRGDQRMTFAELLDIVPRAAAVLADHGAGPGDRVMLLAFNSVEWIVGYWATLAAGGVVVLANAWWSEAELQHSLGVVDAQLVLADAHSAKRVPAGVPVLDVEDLATDAAGRSATALAAADLDPLSQQIKDYETSIKDRLGDAPPVPIVGYGSLEEKFRQLGQELGFGTITPEDAASQFFAEMDVVLNQ